MLETGFKYLRNQGRQLRDVSHMLWRGRLNMRKHQLAYYNFWDVGPVEDSWFYRFLQRPAFKDRIEGWRFAIYSVFGRRELIKVTSADIRIFFSGENLSRYPSYLDYAGPSMDLTMGFDQQNLATNHLRFPLWLLYAFEPEDTLYNIQSRIQAYDTRCRADTSPKKLAATLVARHDNTGTRAIIADAVAENIPVYYPAPFRRNVPEVLKDDAAKLSYIANHVFNICPENTAALGYVTEKLFHAIMAGCVPIYWGAAQRPEPGILNHKRVLFFDPADTSAGVTRLKRLCDSPDELLAFRDQPPFTPDAANNVYDFYLRLEEAILALVTKLEE